KERRRYLDVILAITVPGYVDALARYRRALAQRARARPADMAPFERILGETGERIVAARCRWAQRWQSMFAQHCVAIGERAEAKLEYVPRSPGDAGALSDAFAA